MLLLREEGRSSTNWRTGRYDCRIRNHGFEPVHGNYINSVTNLEAEEFVSALQNLIETRKEQRRLLG